MLLGSGRATLLEVLGVLVASSHVLLHQSLVVSDDVFKDFSEVD